MAENEFHYKSLTVQYQKARTLVHVIKRLLQPRILEPLNRDKKIKW